MTFARRLFHCLAPQRTLRNRLPQAQLQRSHSACAASALLLLTLGCVSSSFAATADAASKLTPGDHYAPVNGVKLHYVIAGKGPLVFLNSPGWGIASNQYQHGFLPLEKNFTMLFIDTRGSGLSSRPADDTQMSAAVMADDIEALRNYLGLPSISLIGHSDGGTIALEYAERHPNPADKVVLLDPAILGDRESATTQHMLDMWKGDPRYKQAILNQENTPDPTTDQAFLSLLVSYLPLYFSDPDRYLPIFMQSLVDSHTSIYAEKMETAAYKKAARDQTKDFGKIQARVLLMNGTVDFVCPVEAALRAHAGIKNSQLSLYANVGHMVWVEEPQRFFSEMNTFLQP